MIGCRRGFPRRRSNVRRPTWPYSCPRSGELWDAKDRATPDAIQDATSNHLNSSTVDYMAEVFDLYLAFQHSNVPVDFVDEEDLTVKGLEPYHSLWVTEPNVPEEGQRGIVPGLAANRRRIALW